MRLEANGVFARRYFYPSLNEVAVLGERVPCPVSEDLSRRILCLPSFTDLSLETVARIAKLVLG
jgi:dTDP-4-amino-4,6-dideoxygalactose transaminase